MKIVINEAQFDKLLKQLSEQLSKEEIDLRANEACPEMATDQQLKSGNYKKGHISVKGLSISIENPKGSKRYYDGGKKYNVMKNHYGYFSRTKGKDGDQVDVFIGPDIDKFNRVYVVDQKINGAFDESKVMLGFLSKKEAKEAYFSNYEENWHGFMHITGVSIKTFKKWLYRGRKQRQPFADYVEIQKKKLNEERERERNLEDIENDRNWKPVRKGSKMNLQNAVTGEYISPEWFNWVGYMYDGISVVRNDDGKYNYLKNDGTLLLDDWYNDCEEFKDGMGRIAYDEGDSTYLNYVDADGNFIGDWKLAN